MSTSKRILVPVEAGRASHKALTTALRLARESGGRVRIIHEVDEAETALGRSRSGPADRRLLEVAWPCA